MAAPQGPATVVTEVGPDAHIEQESDVVTYEEESDLELEFLDWSRELVFEYVETLNDGVDSFFMGDFLDDELINDESSGSNGRIFLLTRRVKDEGVDYQTGLSLKLVLPRTRDRLKLLVETDENEDGQKESDLIGTTDNVTYSTAIRVELRDGRRWKTSWDNGVRWAGEPVYFSRVRARRTDYFGEWRSRILQSIYWRTDDKWGAKLNTSILRPLDLTRHFSAGFNADYLLTQDFADLESNVAIFDELTHRSAMLYRIAALGDTDSLTKVNEYIFTISYRRKIYKNFVFAELTPEVSWPRELNYEATPALNFRLEMIFGPNAN
jgi:hypothetical protein